MAVPVFETKILYTQLLQDQKYICLNHENCDIHTVCAVLLDSIARNHAFVEGNKRTGLLTAILTYELNGIAIKASADRKKEFEELVLWVVLRKPSIEEIAQKLKILTDRYRESKISQFIKILRSTLAPFNEDS